MHTVSHYVVDVTRWDDGAVALQFRHWNGRAGRVLLSENSGPEAGVTDRDALLTSLQIVREHVEALPEDVGLFDSQPPWDTPVPG